MAINVTGVLILELFNNRWVKGALRRSDEPEVKNVKESEHGSSVWVRFTGRRGGLGRGQMRQRLSVWWKLRASAGKQGRVSVGLSDGEVATGGREADGGRRGHTRTAHSHRKVGVYTAPQHVVLERAETEVVKFLLFRGNSGAINTVRFSIIYQTTETFGTANIMRWAGLPSIGLNVRRAFEVIITQGVPVPTAGVARRWESSRGAGKTTR